MQLLETGDIASLTTNAVAAKAGVSIGTLYQYFGSKHALLDALVTRELGAMTDKIVEFDAARNAHVAGSQATSDSRNRTCGDRLVWRAKSRSSPVDGIFVDEQRKADGSHRFMRSCLKSLRLAGCNA